MVWVANAIYALSYALNEYLNSPSESKINITFPFRPGVSCVSSYLIDSNLIPALGGWCVYSAHHAQKNPFPAGAGLL
jgi:hypothetical protein